MLAKGIALRLRARSTLGAMLLAWAVQPVWAHGVHVTAEVTQAVQVRVAYDTGQPMAMAQVALFAPTDPTQVWARGETDADGIFTFVPDPAQQGQWTVQVRQAGHGAIITVRTDGAAPQATASPTQQSTAQKLLMIALVAWGALGTALFFWRRKESGHASS